MKTIAKKRWVLFTVLGILLLTVTVSFRGNDDRLIYRSPETVSFSPDNQYLAVNDMTMNTLYLVSPEKGEIVKEFPLSGKAKDIVWLDNNQLLVSEYETGKVLKFDIEKENVVKEYATGPNPFHMAVNNNELWIGLYGLDKVVVVDLSSGKVTNEVKIKSLPWDIEIAADQGLALVTNLIPAYPANGEKATASVLLVDLDTKEIVKEVFLPHGSSNLRHLKVSSDGRWAYAVHTRGKTSLPTNQLERGWVNTNMLSIIDLENQEWYASVLLDLVREGASDPWDVIENEKDGSLMISLAGVNEIAKVKMQELHQHLEGKDIPDNLRASNAGAYTAYDVWQEIKADPSKRTKLQDQISALYAANLIEREGVPVKAPRGLDISDDGKVVALAGHFSGEIILKNLNNNEIRKVSLGKQSEPDLVRKGEIEFHDGTKTLQSWLSCFSCHPDIRADGLNWDLLNDGIGNPKNTKSLIWTHLTPPVMATGARETYDLAVEKGFHFRFYEGTEPEIDAVRAYLASLSPEKSPYAKVMESDRSFRKSVKRGESLFTKSKCNDCHSAPLYTDQKKYDFGIADERGITAFDVPTLRELWRTAPFWHDGRYANLKEMLTDKKINDVHGNTKDLDEKEINDLTNYLLTL